MFSTLRSDIQDGIGDNSIFNSNWRNFSQSERKKEFQKLLTQVRSGSRRNRLLSLTHVSGILNEGGEGGTLLMKLGFVEVLLDVIRKQVSKKGKNGKKKKKKDLDLHLLLLTCMWSFVETKAIQVESVLLSPCVKSFLSLYIFSCTPKTTQHLCLAWLIAMVCFKGPSSTVIYWKTTRRAFCNYFQVDGRGMGKRVFEVFGYLISRLNLALRNRKSQGGGGEEIMHLVGALLPGMYKQCDGWWKNDMANQTQIIVTSYVKLLKMLVVLMKFDKNNTRMSLITDGHVVEMFEVIQSISWNCSTQILTKKYVLTLYNFIISMIYTAPPRKRIRKPKQSSNPKTVLTNSSPHCDQKKLDVVLGGIWILSSIYQRCSSDILVSTFQEKHGLLIRKIVIPLIFTLSPDSRKIIPGYSAAGYYHTNVSLLNFCFRVLWNPLDDPWIRSRFDQAVLGKLLDRLLILWKTCVKWESHTKKTMVKNEDVISFYRHIVPVITILHGDERHVFSAPEAEKRLVCHSFFSHLAKIFPCFPPRVQGNFLGICFGPLVSGIFLRFVGMEGESLKNMLDAIVEGTKKDNTGILKGNGTPFFHLLQRQRENDNAPLPSRDYSYDTKGRESVFLVSNGMPLKVTISPVLRKCEGEVEWKEEMSSGIKEKHFDPQEVKTCDGCKRIAVGKLQRCSRCKSVYYCSRECQVKGWKEHKKICKKSS